ncbi:FecR family protein [Parabacteroides bouchesdurhonensis]|uniref:FecR family protein n=1 Tax=Parabacteroides bouchesdurhonensis TaxID=1936995 RepID=UPI000C840CDB|nr:FecR domain-containing protein [Parabacteroides bouchesdurhonensis]RHJ88940.1 DUF4974 domain-containing protein [Bacteroides sp. AM07-16]
MERDDKQNNEVGPDGTILLRYVRGIASEEEKTFVENWVEEKKENETVLLQIARIYHAQKTQKRISSRDVNNAFAKVRQKRRKHVLKLYLKKTSMVAACFIGILIVSLAITRIVDEQKLGLSKPQTIKIQANAGMRTTFDLPDGTIVYLNSGSSVTYPLPYDKDKRAVSLVGEAYFKVTHNPECPFVVSVADDRMKVKVLGTEFNLQAYAHDDIIRTTLVKGRVDIEIKTNKGETYCRHIHPSERASYDLKSQDLNVETVNTIYDTAWMEGKLMFKDNPLPEVLKRLSYFYNVTFEVKDPIIRSYCFTGTFENRQLSQILDYLKISSNIDYRINVVTTDDSKGVTRTKVILWKRK